VNYAVQWGLAHRNLDGIEAIGVDEVLWHRGHKYLTVVYQIDNDVSRLLWVEKDRTTDCLSHFFDDLSSKTDMLRFVCSDMWKPYISVITERSAHAVHVLDRSHVAAMLNKAIDHVRADEAKRQKKDGHEPILMHSRWSLLKRRENLTEKQELKLKGFAALQPQNHARLFAQRRFASPVVLCLTFLGRQVSGSLVHPRHALENRAGQKSRTHPSCTSIPFAQLVCGPRREIGRGRRRHEQQAKSDHQKSVWLSNVQSHASRPLSWPWATSDA
jgi:hypothetical protein